MAKGDLHIISTKHLPKENVLLIHYSVNTTGAWIYTLCHCGYRGVCKNDWTIMIPNHQHPLHTDARVSQPLFVLQSGQNGTFAWNYGGIVGVSPQDFASSHSYLVQLTMMDLNVCSGSGPPGGPILNKTGIVSGYIGKGGPDIKGNRESPAKVPPPGGPRPPKAVPFFSGDPTSGPPEYIIPIGTTTHPGGNKFGLGSSNTPRSTPSVSVRLDQFNSAYKPLANILEGGLNYSILKPIDNINRNFGNLTTEAKNLAELKGGPGFQFGRQGGPGAQEFTRNPVDGDEVSKQQSIIQGRDLYSDRAANFDEDVDFPVAENVSLGIDLDPYTELGPNKLAINQESILLSAKSDSDRKFGGGPVERLASTTVDSDVAIGNTYIIVTSDYVVRGEQLGVTSSFIPDQGSEIYVSGVLTIVDTNGIAYDIYSLGVTLSTSELPAHMNKAVRTDILPEGKATVSAVYKDRKGLVAGIATTQITIIQPSTEVDEGVVDTYQGRKVGDISQSLRDLTQVGEDSIDLVVDRQINLIVNKISDSNNSSFVVLPLDAITENRGMSMSVYDLALVTEDFLTRPKNLPLVQTGPVIYSSTTPTLVNGTPTYEDEHILGHVPVPLSVDTTMFRLRKEGKVEDESLFVRLYLHTNHTLRPTTRTSLVRSGTEVTLVYSVPFAAEAIRLVVKGFTLDSLPETNTYYTSTTNVQGEVTFAGVTAKAENYISLLYTPYNLANNQFYSEVLGV